MGTERNSIFQQELLTTWKLKDCWRKMNILLIFNFFLIVPRHCSALNCHVGTYYKKPDGTMSHSTFEDGLGRSSSCSSQAKCITYSGTLKNKDTGEIYDLRYKGICALESFCEPENWVEQVKINSITDLGVSDPSKLIEGDIPITAECCDGDNCNNQEPFRPEPSSGNKIISFYYFFLLFAFWLSVAA